MVFSIRTSHVTDVFYDLHPDALWAPGHTIYDYCAKISKELEKNTKATAPGGVPGRSHSRWGHKATGKLAAEINAFGYRTGPESYRIVLLSPTRYARFVHGGTAGQGAGYIYTTAGFANRANIDRLLSKGFLIAPTSRLQGPGGRFISMKGTGQFMKLPLGTSNKATRRWHLRVRGQLPNAYLLRGWNQTDADHNYSLGAFEEAVGFLWPQELR